MLYAKAYNNKTKKKAQPVFAEMTERIRKMGSLSEKWGPGWEESKADKLASFALPCDQSKRIFNAVNLDELGVVIDLACRGVEEDGVKMKAFMAKHVETLGMLCLNRECEAGEIGRLGMKPPPFPKTLNASLPPHPPPPPLLCVAGALCDETFACLVTMNGGGMPAVTNYFHALGCGHITWLSRIYGNLWRFRNEGVEAFNGVVSTRHNRMNNMGGNKGSNGKKLRPFEVLGKWLGRCCAWQHGGVPATPPPLSFQHTHRVRGPIICGGP